MSTPSNHPKPAWHQETESRTAGMPRILVVDDEKPILLVLARMLASDHYQIFTAEDGERAKHLLNTEPFDLLLTDINLPQTSGLDLMRYCRLHHPRTEVILITGQPQLADAVAAVKDGAFDYLSKPVEAGKLRALVKAALKAREKRVQALDESTMLLTAEISKLRSYQMIRTIGTGHFGTVFLAEKDGVPYAVKFLNLSSDAKLIKRFLEELEIYTRITHEGMVKIFEYGFDHHKMYPYIDKAFPYIVMEFIDGPSLLEVIRRNALSLTEKIELLRQIALPLKVVHEHGLVYRNVKPGNILMTKGKPKLTDFGMVHLCDTSLSMTLELIGAPAYIAPEMFSGNQDIDQRADLFSLGVLGYELLTGSLPFHGTNFPAIAFAVMNQRPVAPSKLQPIIPPEVDVILARLLEKNPADRYQSAGELIADLKHYLSGIRDDSPATWRKEFNRDKWE